MPTEDTFRKIALVESPLHPLARTGLGGTTRRQGFLGYVFLGQPFDALVLSLPVHNGTNPAIARQLHHRLLARLASSRVHHRQWLCIGGGALLCLPALRPETHWVLLYPDLAGVLGAGLFTAGLALLPSIFMRGICSAALREEVAGIIRRCFLRELPPGTPADLQDPWRHGWITADARPVSSEITEADIRFRLTPARAWWWIPSLLSLAVGATTLALGGMGIVIVTAAAALKLLLDRDPGADRPYELEAAEAVEAAAFVEAGGSSWALSGEEARRRQLSEAIRQKAEPVVHLGRASGILAARGDFFAPSPDLPVGLSRLDLRTHLLVFGGTGAGKTSGLLRPIAQQVSAWGDTGLLVLDGKGSLPQELTVLPGMKVIDPAAVKISLVKGLAPDVLVGTISDVIDPPGGSQDPFWRNSGQTLLRHSAVLAKAAGGGHWNLQTAAGLGTNLASRQLVLKSISDECLRTDPMVAAAVEYFQYDWMSMDERTRSGIATTVQTWTAVLTAHRDLLAWARATPDEDDVPLESVLQGGRFGLLLPAHRYAQAGALVTALLKARVYTALKRRAEGWSKDDTPVVFLIDEAQEVATRDDASMLSIGRSLGLSVVAATQTKEAVVEKLGRETAAKWLGIYGSIVALQGRSPETDHFVAEKLGVTWKPHVSSTEGMAVRTSILAQSVSGAVAATQYQASLAPYITSSLLQHRAPMGVLSGLKRALFGTETSSRPQSLLGACPVATGGELAMLLAEPDTALAVINRARVPWRDVIRLDPAYVSTSARSHDAPKLPPA